MLSHMDVVIDVFFDKLPMDQRVREVAALGYTAIETWQGGNAAVVKAIGDACAESGVRFAGIVMNGPSDMRVAPVKSGNRAAFLEQIDRFSDNALAAGCRAGIVTTGNIVPEQSPEAHRENLITCLAEAGALVAPKGFTLNLEPLNTLVDHKGYYLDSRETALAVVQATRQPNVKLLYDLYHMQVMGGNHLAFLLPNLASIGHMHLAGVPGRHEVFTSELRDPFVMRTLIEAGYTGLFGLEYLPSLPSAESLRKTASYLARA